MSFMTYLPNGQAVCAEHCLIVCGKCCVDFTSPEFQRDSEEESEDDRVFVLGEALLACYACEVTWLEGKEDYSAASSHPSRHTLFHEYAGTSRSLIAHTDGACIDNGRAAARAGIGVYFGPQSKYNVSALLDGSNVPTSQAAELCALLQAMQVVRKDVVPARSALVHGDHDAKRFRLVLATDSSYAVECMCKHFKGWTMDNRQGVLKSRQGKEIVNSEILLAIKAEVEKLSRVGVQVTYYHVGRELNEDADALARAGAAA